MATKSKSKGKKDYNAIAKEKIYRPSEVKAKPKFLIYARNKIGKTKFLMSAPGILVADPEHGTDKYVKEDPHVWPIESWDDLDDYYKFLRTAKHDYEFAGLDGLTRMHNMALTKVMKLSEEKDLDRIPGMVRRQDYGKAGELTKRMLYNFLNLPMGVIFTAQERMVTITAGDDGDDDELETASVEYVPDLPKGARSAVNGIVDVIGRMYVQRVKVRVKGSKEIKEINQRRLHIGPHQAYDTGYRSDYELPDFVRNPTVPKLLNMILTGKE